MRRVRDDIPDDNASAGAPQPQRRRMAAEDGEAEAAAAAEVEAEEEEGQEEVAMEVEEIEDRTRAFPHYVPREHEFESDRYYVRNCYRDYYDVVMEMLDEKRGVAVTGTPGIGKSLFMAYFFERYRAQYPDATILMLAYDNESVLKRVVVAKAGEEVKKEIVSTSRMEQLLWRHATNAPDKSIYLLDGPPRTVPRELPWVSFSSPNERWFRKLDKIPEVHYMVYMPTWTLAELRDAAQQLGRTTLLEETTDDQLRHLGFDPTTEPTPRRPLVDVYFDVFGGVPRLCFLTDPRVVVRKYASLQDAISGLTLGQILKALRKQTGSSDSAKQVHRVVHYEPTDLTYDEIWGFPYQEPRVHVGSIVIKRLIMERGKEIAFHQEEPLKTSLNAASEGHIMVRYFYEARMYRLLKAACKIEARPLVGVDDRNVDGTSPASLVVTVPKESNVGWITNTFRLHAFGHTRKEAVLPYTKSLGSIGGCYWHPDGRVVLFQVATLTKRPVKARGIRKVLEALGIWEAFARSPATVAALVFVVPLRLADDFKKQTIESSPLLADESPVTAITGIADGTATTLRAHKIMTVGDLRSKDVDDVKDLKGRYTIKKAQETLHTYELEIHGHKEALFPKMPQYVWGI